MPWFLPQQLPFDTFFAALYIDASKAFSTSTVDYKILCNKLLFALKLKSVVADSAESSLHAVNNGVHEGSNLGQLLL